MNNYNNDRQTTFHLPGGLNINYNDRDSYINRNRRSANTNIPTEPPPPYSPIQYTWDKETLKLGFNMALNGIKNMLSHEPTRQKLWKALNFLLANTLIIYVAGKVITLPFHALKILQLFGFSKEKTNFLPEHFEMIFNWIIRVFPQFSLLFIRYVFPKYLDDLFFESFKGYKIINAETNIPSRELLLALNYSQELSKCKPKRSYLKMFWNYCKRLVKNIFKGILFYALTQVPGIGKLVVPAYLFKTIKDIFNFNVAATVSLLVWQVPFLKNWTNYILFNWLFGIRSMNREILEPFFCRVRMTKEEKAKWFKFYEPLLMGFMAPFYFLFLKPWYGPLFYGVAQGAISTLLIELFKDNRPRLTNINNMN